MLGQLSRIQFIRDQLVPGGNIDAHIAWMLEWRTGNADVHLLGASITQQLDDRTDRVATNDRIVDQDDTFSFDVAR